MLNWLDIIKFAKGDNPKPDRYVLQTEEEWKQVLTPEQFRITRKHGTERPFSGEHCQAFDPALYGCVCCESWLFESRDKFESGTGWPSFTQPVKENAVKYVFDESHNMRRVEVLCNVCQAHLGHVFPDGPMPSGLRYCLNSVSLKKVKTVDSTMKLATLGGGCFWCTEAIFQQLKGVKSVLSGYSGGHEKDPTYNLVCTGKTGHAEVIQIVYDSEMIGLADLIQVHLHLHNSTTPNRQGADKGNQYRSIIFYRNEEEKNSIEQVIQEEQANFDAPICTQLAPFEIFYPAEDRHHNYYNSDPEKPYCKNIINPKLIKLREKFSEKVKF